jgi:hypothetical protein
MKRVPFPHLDVARDPERMIPILQNHLRPANGTAIAVQGCAVDYVRQSQGRLLLQYMVRLAEPASGRAWDQRVTGVSYGEDRTDRLVKRLLASGAAATQPVGEPALLPLAYVPELDLMLQVFPYDHHLPALALLLQPSLTVTQSLLDGDAADWTIEAWQAEVLRYRPDQRAAVRLDIRARHVNGDRIATPRAYAKVYAERQEGERAHRLQTALWAAAQEGETAFTVAQPIAYVASLSTMLLGEAPGVRLLDIARRGESAEAVAAMRRAARAIAALHQVRLDGVLASARRDERARLSEVAGMLREIAPDQAETIDALAATIAAALGEASLAPTHFDLKLGHVLIADDGVALLDFDKMALADPLIDVANLSASLGTEREGSPQRVKRRTVLAEVFLAEYLSHVPADWRPRLPARFALATLAEAATTGRGLRGRPGRDNRAARVVAALRDAQETMTSGR